MRACVVARVSKSEDNCELQFCFTLWVMRIKLRSSALAGSAITLSTISPTFSFFPLFCKIIKISHQNSLCASLRFHGCAQLPGVFGSIL